MKQSIKIMAVFLYMILIASSCVKDPVVRKFESAVDQFNKEKSGVYLLSEAILTSNQTMDLTGNNEPASDLLSQIETNENIQYLTNELGAVASDVNRLGLNAEAKITIYVPQQEIYINTDYSIEVRNIYYSNIELVLGINHQKEELSIKHIDYSKTYRFADRHHNPHFWEFRDIVIQSWEDGVLVVSMQVSYYNYASHKIENAHASFTYVKKG